MSRKLEGLQVGFLRQLTGNKATQHGGRTWRSAAEARVLKESCTHTLGTYIDKIQATVAEWVELIPILKVCNMDTVYEGGGRYWETWWNQMVAWKHLSAMLEEILSAARVRRWESGWRCKGGGGQGGIGV